MIDKILNVLVWLTMVATMVSLVYIMNMYCDGSAMHILYHI